MVAALTYPDTVGFASDVVTNLLNRTSIAASFPFEELFVFCDFVLSYFIVHQSLSTLLSNSNPNSPGSWPVPKKRKGRWVAPHAGAWIETFFGGRVCLENGVAPHAGAWIETGRHVMTQGDVGAESA